MTAVWRMDIPTTDKMVLLALADAANDDGVTWIAVSSRKPGTKLDLKKKTSLSERAIQGAIRRLTAAGHLQRTERLGKGVIYRVTPAADAPRTSCAPASADTLPRTSCGETVNNRQLVVAAATRARPSLLPGDEWPAESIAAIADLLIAEAGSDRLNPRKEVGLSTTLDALETWRHEGAPWSNVVVPVVATLARQTGQPIKSWHFFNRTIADALACFSEPLPAVKAA